MTHGAIIDLLKLGYVMFLTHIAYKGVLWALNYDNNHKGGGVGWKQYNPQHKNR